MAKTKKTKPVKETASAAPDETAGPVAGKATTRTKATGLVPLQRRLGKLRKAEAKRQRQLQAIQDKAARTSDEMTQLLKSVTNWLEHPEATAEPEHSQKNGMRESVVAGH